MNWYAKSKKKKKIKPSGKLDTQLFPNKKPLYTLDDEKKKSSCSSDSCPV